MQSLLVVGSSGNKKKKKVKCCLLSNIFIIRFVEQLDYLYNCLNICIKS